MAVLHFILSILIALCAVAMFFSALFIHTNTHVVVILLFALICFGAFLLVKISYNELKS